MRGTLDLAEANVPQYVVDYNNADRVTRRLESIDIPVFVPVLNTDEATPGKPIPVEVYIHTNLNEDTLETKAENIKMLDYTFKHQLLYGFVVSEFLKYYYEKDKTQKELVSLLAECWLDNVGEENPVISEPLKREAFTKELAETIEPYVKDIHKVYNEFASSILEIRYEDEAKLIGLDYFLESDTKALYEEFKDTPPIPVATSIWDYLVDTLITELNQVANEFNLGKA